MIIFLRIAQPLSFFNTPPPLCRTNKADVQDGACSWTQKSMEFWPVPAQLSCDDVLLEVGMACCRGTVAAIWGWCDFCIERPSPTLLLRRSVATLPGSGSTSAWRLCLAGS